MNKYEVGDIVLINTSILTKSNFFPTTMVILSQVIEKRNSVVYLKLIYGDISIFKQKMKHAFFTTVVYRDNIFTFSENNDVWNKICIPLRKEKNFNKSTKKS